MALSVPNNRKTKQNIKCIEISVSILGIYGEKYYVRSQQLFNLETFRNTWFRKNGFI